MGLPHEEVDPEKQVSLVCDSAESDKTSSPPCALFGLEAGVVATEAVARRRSEPGPGFATLWTCPRCPAQLLHSYSYGECAWWMFCLKKVNGNVVSWEKKKSIHNTYFFSISLLASEVFRVKVGEFHCQTPEINHTGVSICVSS